MQKINVIDYLKATVEKYPNKKAITDKNGTITFNELYNQAVALANVIIKQTNYVHNKPIAVLMLTWYNIVVTGQSTKHIVLEKKRRLQLWPIDIPKI